MGKPLVTSGFPTRFPTWRASNAESILMSRCCFYRHLCGHKASLGINMSYQYMHSHYKDETISWPSCLFTGKTLYLYWISHQLSYISPKISSPFCSKKNHSLLLVIYLSYWTMCTEGIYFSLVCAAINWWDLCMTCRAHTSCSRSQSYFIVTSSRCLHDLPLDQTHYFFYISCYIIFSFLSLRSCSTSL